MKSVASYKKKRCPKCFTTLVLIESPHQGTLARHGIVVGTKLTWVLHHQCTECGLDSYEPVPEGIYIAQLKLRNLSRQRAVGPWEWLRSRFSRFGTRLLRLRNHSI